METTKATALTKNIFWYGVLLTGIIFFSACAKKINFLNSAVTPAARGDVKIKKDGNNNYNINIHLLNLAESNRLQPPKNTYVVWMESTDSYVKNIGQIKSDINFLAKKLKASFETVSTVKPTRIFITAEDDGSVQYPGTVVVLTTGSL